MKVREAARRLDVAEETIRRYVDSKRLTALDGRPMRVTVDSVERERRARLERMGGVSDGPATGSAEHDAGDGDTTALLLELAAARSRAVQLECDVARLDATNSALMAQLVSVEFELRKTRRAIAALVESAASHT